MVQVSRWDRPTSTQEILEHVVGDGGDAPGKVHLMPVGPCTVGGADDPGGAEVLAGCEEASAAPPAEACRRT